MLKYLNICIPLQEPSATRDTGKQFRTRLLLAIGAVCVLTKSQFCLSIWALDTQPQNLLYPRWDTMKRDRFLRDYSKITFPAAETMLMNDWVYQRIQFQEDKTYPLPSPEVNPGWLQGLLFSQFGFTKVNLHPDLHSGTYI